MRSSLAAALLLSLSLAPAARGDKPAESRYGVKPDLMTYPQAAAKDALASVIKAVADKRIDYVVAQLADPDYIDDKVANRFGGKFDEQIEDTRIQMNPATLKLFERFLKDGEWVGGRGEDTECVRLKDVSDRCIYFRRVGGRWYLQNNNKPAE
jgi:hypothetical protein